MLDESPCGGSRGDVDDAAGTVIGQVRECGLDQQCGCSHIQIERLLEEVNVKVLDGLGIDDGGVVDENIDLKWPGLAEVSFCSFDKGSWGGRVE